MGKAILLYDDECQFCNKWINFVKSRLENKEIFFISLNSSKAVKILANFKIENQDSVVYIADDIFFLRSRAVLKICSQLRSPYKFLKHLTIFPSSLLDYCYDFIAKRRLICNQNKEYYNG